MNHPLRKRLGVFLAVSAMLGSAVVGSAQETIAHYSLNANTASSADSSLASASVLSLTAGGSRSTAAAGTGLDGFVGSYAKTNSSNGVADSLADAISLSQYLSFTITPTESLNVLSLGFDFAASNNTTSVDPYVGSWGVFSSLTGFTSGDILATNSVSTPKSTGLTATWSSFSVDLSGVSSLQSVAVSPIEIRLYFWDNSATSTTNLVVRFDEIALTATSAIPEPSTYAALFGVAALGLVLWRRRARCVASA